MQHGEKSMKSIETTKLPSETLTGSEFTTFMLSVKDSDRSPDALTGPRAIEEAIHDGSEESLNVFGRAGWQVAAVTHIPTAKRGKLNRFLVVLSRPLH